MPLLPITKLTKLVPVLFLLGFASISIAQGDTWTSKADMPTERLGLASCAVNGKIYAIGGYAQANAPGLTTVEEYNPVTNTWSARADMPTGRRWLSVTAVNGKCYAVGGHIGVSQPGLQTIEEYDPATNEWRGRTDMPTARIGHTSAAVDGKLYIIGGVTSPSGSALSTVEEYDPASNTWTMKADMPTARIFPAASTVDELIYVVGGSRSTNQPSYSLVEQYDPATDTWTAKTGMPTARFILATAVVNGRVYAIGGRNDGELPLSVVEEYTPAQDEWTARASMPVKRTGLAASEVAGKIYTMGGSQFIPPPHPGSGKTKEYTPPTFNQFNDQVQKMYVAYYGRPGDPGGIGFWGGRLQESGGDLSDIINEFGTSDEFTDRYGGLANEELVNNIYLQLFNRSADPEGLEFYVGWLLEGTRSLGDIALAIADGVQAGTDDFDIVANKLQVANTFSDKVTECDASYGAEEINGAKEIINSVDSTDTSVDVALGQIDALLC